MITIKKPLTLNSKREDGSNSSNGANVDQSFMTVIQQAGMGGRTKLNVSATVTQFDDIITNFVSREVRRVCHKWCEQDKPYASHNDKKLPEIRPTAVDAFAAVVMVDVSGYSKLTAALAERGPVGAELLSKTMKGYLDQIIAVIVSHGGDIVKFAGDAVVVYWRSETAINMGDSSEDIERGELVYKAAHCCLTLLTQLGTYDINIADCATKTLRIHLGIGAGLITDLLVGGAPGRWEHLIAGDGVNQLSQVLDLAKAGELALSHQALKWLVWVVDIRTLNLGDYDKRCIILTGLAKAERRVPAPIDKEETLVMSSPKKREQNMALYRFFMDRTALFKLQSDLNQSNLFQLDSGLLELLNLGELRQITTIFIKIGSLKDVQRDDLLEQCQDAIQVVQNALHHCDGSLRQFQVDDKGASILCFFGLPPLAHENDSKLGISAGIEIREKFSDMFEDFSMGITTGVVSFGGVGSVGRAEYAVMGDAINMAARLMCHKDAARGILCDEKTFNLCDSDFHFENLGETTVKGKASPIAIFRPVYAIAETDKNEATTKTSSNLVVIGREPEKTRIAETLKQLSSSPSVDLLLFCAEGGQGLSTLVNYSKAEAIKQGCSVCTGKAIQIERNNSFFVFKSIVVEVLHLLNICVRNKEGQLRIPGNTGTVNLVGQVLPTAMLPSKPGAKKRANPNLPTSDGTSKPVQSKANRKPSTISPSEELSGARRVSHAIPERLNEDEEDAITMRFKQILQKIDIGEDQAALLQLVTSPHNDESDEITQAHLRLHARDLCDIMTLVFNHLTLHNKLIIQVTEAHYLDSLSWDLLLELAVACPRLSIMTFSRPTASFESKDNRRLYKLIDQLPRSKSNTLTGLSSVETEALILATWTGHTITKVDAKIAESIFKRTDGNPFFTRSLVIALKESGQWRISGSGCLTTPDINFDFDRLVLGYDKQSIILAQFDRLDRNFQLFLKVASVLGQKFALDDVLLFLTGIANAVDQVERKQYSQIISGLAITDQYGFLQKETNAPDGAYFQFKSAVIRKCIYSMMVVNQRQQIHLLIAQYMEGKMNDQNRHRYVVQILDHYMFTAPIHKSKRLHYTSMTAKYFYEKDSAAETIKYCKQWLDLVESSTPAEVVSITRLQIANCHRELGASLLMKEEFAEAESHLRVALKIMGYAIPASGYKFSWALRSESSKRNRLDKAFFRDRPVPKEEDYTQSYVARKGASGYSLSNIVIAGISKAPKALDGAKLDDMGVSSGNVLPRLATLTPAQQMIRNTRESLLLASQHAFVTLAEVYMRSGKFELFNYVILVGLNISTSDSSEGHLSRLFALGALNLRNATYKNAVLASQYMEASISYDLRIDIHTSLQQVVNNGTLLYLAGQLESSQNKLEVVSYLSTMANDLSSRVYGLILKCMLQSLSVSKLLGLVTSRDLLLVSNQRESWVGKMWASFHIVYYLLGDPSGDQEISERMTEMAELWNDCPDKDSNRPLEIALVGLKMAVPLFKKDGGDGDMKEGLEQLVVLVDKIAFHQWQTYSALLPVALSILASKDRGLIKDEAVLKLVEKVCTLSNNALKRMKGLYMGGPLRALFKGIKLWTKGKDSAAIKAWLRGVEETSEDIFVQALLHASIFRVDDSESVAEAKAEDYSSDLKAKDKFAMLYIAK